MKTCNHEMIKLNNKSLHHFKKQCLSHAQSTLFIDGMTFSIQFCVNNTVQKESYLKLCNEFLKVTCTLIPCISKIFSIPFKSNFCNQARVYQ